MFEKIKINENSKEISDKVNELYELVANDPQYVEFTNSGESFESLAEYVSSDADLSKMVQTMKNVLSTINPRVFHSYGTLNLHKSIVCINKLNGYPSKENPLIVLPNSVIEETTEKKPGTSMTEMVYAYLDNKGYGGIRNDKMDRMGNSYLVYTNVAKKQYVQDKADDIIRDYISKRTDEKYRISETRSSLELDRRHAKEYFEKAQQNFKNLPDTKAEIAAFKTGGTSFSTVLLNQLQRELQSIDKGRTPGHEDTAEFTAMKDFLQEACDYVTYTKELLDQKDPAAFEGLKQKLTDMKTKSSEYYDKKMEHDKWHLKPSKMRFVRLEAAKRLQRVADFNIENADNILKVCADAAELQEKTANIQIEDPGTNFKEFVLNHVPEATKNKVIAIDQQRAADKLQSSRKNEERERIVI